MLTDMKARKLKAEGKPLAVGGVAGLYLRPGSKDGVGKFTLRFVSPETGKRRDMGLGTYPAISIALARKYAFEARELIERAIDPIENRKQEQTSTEGKAQSLTFEDAALQVYGDIAPGFKNEKHRAQWINTLKTYAFPEIGSRRIDQLTTADFATFLKPIWLSKPETASRVRQRCERVMTWCVAHDIAPTNPVSAVSALLPKQKRKRDRVEHFPSMPWRNLPAFGGVLFGAERLSVGRQALLFLILTAARSGEIRGAKWEEIDVQSRVWTLPAERMKAGVQHRVPLSDQALLLLEKRMPFRGGDGWVFSNTGASALSDMTLTKVLRDQKVESDVPDRWATAHGFRSSFRDWASENQFARDLAERALAHRVQNETEAAYHRTDLLERRRAMMQDWGDFVCGTRTGGSIGL